MASTFTTRVAAKAAEVRPARAALSVLAAPFYVVGWLLGLVFVVLVWCWAAAQVGFGDARTRPTAAAAVPAVEVNDGAG